MSAADCEWVIDDNDAVCLLEMWSLVAPTRGEVRQWPKELKTQRKLRLHSNRMTRFRNKRAAEKKLMQEEHQRLEMELKRCLVELRRGGTGPDAMRRLTLEREALRDERVALQEAITRYRRFLRVTCNAGLEVEAPQHNAVLADNVTVRCIESEWQAVHEPGGRRVDFTGGEPSFFFHPFSQRELNAALNRAEEKFGGNTSCLSFAGAFLGWEVSNAPLERRVASNELLGWTRYSKRLRCTVDTVQNTMRRADGSNEWPILPSSRNLGWDSDITIQTLQQFDSEAYVIVRSYPGAVNYRYLGLVQHVDWERVNGRRVLKYKFVIANSEANARSRDAEPTAQRKVRWVDEGGSLLTITEVDDGAVDVEFNHWACFKGEQQAQIHFVSFGRIVTRWEELVALSKLLTFE